MNSRDNSTSDVAVLLLVMKVGFFSAVAYHYWAHFYHGFGFPRAWFLVGPDALWGEYKRGIMASLHPGGHSSMVLYSFHAPLKLLLLQALNALPSAAGALAVNVATALSLFWYLVGSLKTLPPLEKLSTSLLLILFGYPVWFAIEQGSLSGLEVACCGLFLVSDREGKTRASCFWLAIAVALEPASAIFALLWLGDGKHWRAGYALASAGVLTLLAFWFTNGTWSIALESARFIFHEYVYRLGIAVGYLEYNPSLYVLLKVYAGRANILAEYILLLLLLIVAASPLARDTRLARWKRILLLCVARVFLLPHATDSSLILIYLAVGEFCADSRPSRSTWMYGSALGLLLAPKNYLFPLGKVSIALIANLAVATCLTFSLVLEWAALRKTPRGTNWTTPQP